MARRTGSADLPLHSGQVPHWLAARMARLGRVVVETIVHHYGRDEFLRRLAHPFWFQCFGAVMGMDWHSSGITTSVMGALKRGLAPVERELGIHICGGRGRHSRNTPAELVAVGEMVGIDGDQLARTSRLVAKVDSAAVQDGFDLYLHSFVVTDDGAWTIVQQGMNVERRQARRYHWLSEGLHSFVDQPHAAIEGPNQGEIVNLTDHRAADARACEVELVHGDPDRVLTALHRLRDRADSTSANGGMPPLLRMPVHHDVRLSDVLLRRLRATLAVAADCGPQNFAELLLVPGVGARTIFALAMVSEVVHGAPCRFSDPARFSMAHGGKDGHPFPVPLKVYDETISVMRTAVDRAKLGNDDKLAAIRRLDEQARVLEHAVAGPGFDEFVAEESQHARDYGGRTVRDSGRHDDQRSGAERRPRQLTLL
jgi:hypothetical protein